jgi:putative polyhydroxyalkanoate system protein
MSKVSVRQSHSVSRSEAKERLASFSEMLTKYGVKLVWSGDKAAVKGMGVSGGVAVDDSAVQVDIKLGMMAKAVGVDPKRLQGSISRRLSEAFDS